MNATIQQYENESVQKNQSVGLERPAIRLQAAIVARETTAIDTLVDYHAWSWAVDAVALSVEHASGVHQ